MMKYSLFYKFLYFLLDKNNFNLDKIFLTFNNKILKFSNIKINYFCFSYHIKKESDYKSIHIYLVFLIIRSLT